MVTNLAIISRYVRPRCQALSYKLGSIEDRAVVRIGSRGSIVAIEVHRAGISTIGGIAQAISTAKTALKTSALIENRVQRYNKYFD